MGEKKSYYAIIPANVRYDKDLTPNAKLLYGEITALCNEKGYCWSENSYFANLYGVSNTSISKWISILVKKRYITSQITYIEGTKQIDKRYLRIVNYPIEEKLNTPIEEKLNENTTNFNNTLNNTDKKENIKRKNSTSEYDDEFEIVWKLYPRKVQKANAKKSYIKARKDGVTFEVINSGVERYAEYCRLKGTPDNYIAHGSTWFNGQRWNDDYSNTQKVEISEKRYGKHL
jgi:hypothetical protein